jgi:hypothetical protein
VKRKKKKEDEFHRTIAAMRVTAYKGKDNKAISLVRIEKVFNGFGVIATDGYIITYRKFSGIYWKPFRKAVLEIVGVEIGDSIQSGYLALDEKTRIKTGLASFSDESAFRESFGDFHRFPSWRNVFPDELKCEGPPPVFNLKILNKIRMILNAYKVESDALSFNPAYNDQLSIAVTEIEGLLIGAMPRRNSFIDNEALTERLKEIKKDVIFKS